MVAYHAQRSFLQDPIRNPSSDNVLKEHSSTPEVFIRPALSRMLVCLLLPLPCLLTPGRLLAFQATTPSFQARSQEVILDLVIRNKHGEAVRDLHRSDVEIYDDGRIQEIVSLSLVDSSQPHAGSTPAFLSDVKVPVSRNGVSEMRFVSLVFDRLAGAAQRNARVAINELLSSALPQDTYVAVFVLDRSLLLLQTFTNDSTLVHNAALRALSGLPAQYAGESARNLAQREELYLKSNAVGLDPADVVLLRILRDATRDERYEQGRSQISALMSLVRYQHSLSGRKAVVYLSQGLVIPPSMRETFGSLITTSNHGKVSFYALDTRGLEGAATAAPGNQLAQVLEAGTLPQGEWQPETLQSDVNSTRMALNELAVKTGGFLSATNDVRAPLHRIWDDLHAYYEVTYRPSWTEYDGRFHKITVRVLRKGLSVSSRDGYYALPDFGGRAMLPYESELLRTLNARPLPADLPTSSIVVCYRMGKTDRCVLSLSIPLKALTPPSSETGAARRLAFLALVRNSSGEVVDVLSRDLRITMPTDKQKTKAIVGSFTRVERFDLVPGRYTVEIVIQDRESLAISGKRVSFYAPEFQGLDASEMVGIRSLLPLEGTRIEDDPLEFGAMYITPNPSSTFENRRDSNAKVYFVVYPVTNSTARVDVQVKIIGTNGVVIPAHILSSDAGTSSAEALPYLLSIPVQDLDSGDYLLETTIRQGEKALERIYPFKIGRSENVVP